MLPVVVLDRDTVIYPLLHSDILISFIVICGAESSSVIVATPVPSSNDALPPTVLSKIWKVSLPS